MIFSIRLNKSQSRNYINCIENNFYPFEKDDNDTIKITPMERGICERVMNKYNHQIKSMIVKNGCYQNSILAALFLYEQGVKAVKIVDGYFIGNQDPLCRKRLHRWIKIGNRYFDPTLEKIIGVGTCDSELTYYPQRIFDIETIVAYSDTVAERNDLGYCFSSTLDGKTTDKDGSPVDFGYLNNDYEFVGGVQSWEDDYDWRAA